MADKDSLGLSRASTAFCKAVLQYATKLQGELSVLREMGGQPSVKQVTTPQFTKALKDSYGDVLTDIRRLPSILAAVPADSDDEEGVAKARAAAKEFNRVFRRMATARRRISDLNPPQSCVGAKRACVEMFDSVLDQFVEFGLQFRGILDGELEETDGVVSLSFNPSLDDEVVERMIAELSQIETGQNLQKTGQTGCLCLVVAFILLWVFLM